MTFSLLNGANLSAHKTPAVRDFLEALPKVRLHFTPRYSSWLNQVEIWLAKIERDRCLQRVHLRCGPQKFRPAVSSQSHNVA